MIYYRCNNVGGESEILSDLTTNAKSWGWGNSENRAVSQSLSVSGYKKYAILAYSYGGQSATNPTISCTGGTLSNQTSITNSRGGVTVVSLELTSDTATISASTTIGGNNGTGTYDLVINAIPIR